MLKANKFQPKPEKKQRQWGEQKELPVTFALGVYARQSTKNQVIKHVQSGEMQTTELTAMGKQYGWAEDQIILFVENRGKDGKIKNASGRLRIDQREGLRTLTEYIEKDIIKAVLVQLEDRLFRDESMIQVNTFIDICKNHDCIVITPHKVYDFENPYDVKQFRWRCEESADYIRDYVYNRLGGALRRIAAQGLYDGRAISLGFIIDRRKTILINDEHAPNPNYKKYIPYEPHAEVRLNLLRMYVKFDGKLKPMYRELCKKPVLFPDFPADMPREVIGNRHVKKVSGGFHLSESGLRDMLCNIDAIGKWLHRGNIRDNNHPRIIPPEEEDKFWFAFNRLSPYLTNGEENTLRPNKARYYIKRNPKALLKECIEAANEGQVIYVANKFGAWYYEISYREPHKDTGRIVTIQVEHLDSIFKDKLLDHLSKTDSYEHYRNWYEARVSEAVSEISSIDKQLETIKRDRAGIQKSLRNPKLRQSVREALEEDLAIILLQREELEDKKAYFEVQRDGEDVINLIEYKKLVEKLAPHWKNLTFSKRMSLVNALVKNLTLESIAPHFLRVVIEWENPTWEIDDGLIWRTQGTAPIWTEEEREIVRELYPSGDRNELLRQLPNRSWTGIQIMGKDLKLVRTVKSQPNGIPYALSLQDYAIIQQNQDELESGGVTLEAISQRSLSNAVLCVWSRPSDC
ncbi:recombinase family protein [Ktedonosporobacter rubrisoli]|uniref:Recombinase family protein n=1 Tax=Ktedonosporobacter rubrisoli TaxID=2509675 RepID=A0A4P6JSD5_KTERU|nr:recombinase family protein [Ktedonosporobacter rubrisoli]QBD78112.1 recombinase family protein [Ktedonosporobacter rubrisoli]